MAVKIITDSTCDITTEMAKEWGIQIVPLSVIFGDEEYIDGISLTSDEFYSKLVSSENLPSTSQVTVDAFIKAFEEATADGSEVVCVTLSSELSGTFQSASIAKSTLNNDKVHLVDSKSVTVALALLVKQGVEMRDEGLSGSEISTKLTELLPKLRLYGIIDTLKYLQKGGRLSAASAVVGSMLGIKPIITVRDGKVEVMHKARGIKAAQTWVVSKAHASNPNMTLGFSFGHTNAPEQMELLMKIAGEEISKSCKITSCIGSVVGTHAGPGCVCIAFFEN